MNNPDKARRYYLREARSLFPRLDELNRIKRSDPDGLTPELLAEKREIEERIYKNGRAIWDVFRKWSEEVCGYKPVTGEDIKRVLG